MEESKKLTRILHDFELMSKKREAKLVPVHICENSLKQTVKFCHFFNIFLRRYFLVSFFDLKEFRRKQSHLHRAKKIQLRLLMAENLWPKQLRLKRIKRRATANAIIRFVVCMRNFCSRQKICIHFRLKFDYSSTFGVYFAVSVKIPKLGSR